MQLKKSLLMHPHSFGSKLHDKIREALYKEVEGTIDGRYGFIIVVTKIFPIPRGRVQEGGYVKFPLTYKAIVFRPFINEVLDTIVVSVDEKFVRCEAGPLTIFVHKEQIPTEMDFDSTGPAYVHGTARIQINEFLRLRITGLKFCSSDISAIGTIKENHLGLIGS